MNSDINTDKLLKVYNDLFLILQDYNNLWGEIFQVYPALAFDEELHDEIDRFKNLIITTKNYIGEELG